MIFRYIDFCSQKSIWRVCRIGTRGSQQLTLLPLALLTRAMHAIPKNRTPRNASFAISFGGAASNAPKSVLIYRRRSRRRLDQVRCGILAGPGRSGPRLRPWLLRSSRNTFAALVRAAPGVRLPEPALLRAVLAALVPARARALLRLVQVPALGSGWWSWELGLDSSLWGLARA